MSSSDSDNDWIPPPRPRRGAAPAASSAKAKIAPPPPPPQPLESSLPDFLFEAEDNNNASANAGPSPSAAPPFSDPKVAIPPVNEAGQTSEERLEALRRQLEAKQRLLRSKQEKESAWVEKWRAEKAQRQAELRQIEAKLNAGKKTLEEEKTRAESELSEAKARYEREILEAQERIQEEVKSEFETQIAELQQKLETMRKEEEELRAQLDAQGGVSDLVQSAIAAAISTILQGVEEKCSKDTLKTEEWIKTVEELVRHEVRSSLAVSADSEAQSERDEHKKNFAEILEFWRHAEEEVRGRIQQMDEVLLSDLQSVLQEDLARLQKEELSMEEVYIQSREAWASQHQAMLQSEVEVLIKRREEELAEYRKLRDQIHHERIAGIEHRHQQRMSIENRMHKEEMEQIRAQFAQEEHLNEERQRIAVATHQDITKATESFKSVAASMEAVLTSLKDYRASVDEGRAVLERDRQEALAARQQTLESVREMVESLRAAIDADCRSLHEASSKLQLAQQQMDEQMRLEAVWLTQQEAFYTKSKESWEREYRRWKQLVQQERHSVEERFYETLGTLRDSVAQLNAEEQEIEVQSTAMKRVFAEMTTSVSRDIASLQKQQQELQSRKEAVNTTLNALEQKGEETAQQWRALQDERTSLASEWEALREEESQLQQMAHSLALVNTQCDTARAQAVAAAEHGRILQYQLSMNRNAVEQGFACSPFLSSNQKEGYHVAPAVHVDPSAPQPQLQPRHAHASSGKKRLPLRTLKELKQHLQNLTNFPEFLPHATLNSAISRIEATCPKPKKKELTAAPPVVKAHSLKTPEPFNVTEFVPRCTPTPLNPSKRSQHRSTNATLHRNSSSLLTEISAVPSSHAGRSLGDTFTNLISFSDADTTSYSFSSP